MAQKRDAYVEMLKEQLDKWNTELDKLEAKADRTRTEGKLEYEKQMADLKERRKDLEDKIDEIQQAGEGAWEDLKAGVEIAWDALGDAIKSATSKFQ